VWTSVLGLPNSGALFYYKKLPKLSKRRRDKHGKKEEINKEGRQERAYLN